MNTTIDPLEKEKFSKMAEEWWDPTGKFKALHKFSPKRPAWGVIGLSIEDAEPFIGQRIDAVKTTPLSTLSPLDGWNNNEINALRLHFENPRTHSINPNVTNWINNH